MCLDGHRLVLELEWIVLTGFLDNRKHCLRSNMIVDFLKASYHHLHRSLVILSSTLRLWRQVYNNNTDQ